MSLSVDLFAEAVTCRAPVGLPVFRRIDAVEVDAMAASGFVQNGAGIAVLNGDDAPSDRPVFDDADRIGRPRRVIREHACKAQQKETESRRT